MLSPLDKELLLRRGRAMKPYMAPQRLHLNVAQFARQLDVTDDQLEEVWQELGVSPGAPRFSSFIVEFVRGAKHVAQFSRTYLAGQSPPAFQLSPFVLEWQGSLGPLSKVPSVAEPVELAVSGPVSIAVAQEPAEGPALVTVRLRDPASGPIAVRLFRGREGSERPLEPIVTFELSATKLTETQRLDLDIDGIHIEVQLLE